MDTSDYRAKTREIIDRLEPSNASIWDHFLATDHHPLPDVVARVTLLVGDAVPELVDGKIDDDDGLKGWLLVTTADRLIRAEFEPGAQGQLKAVVESASLSTVRTVRVDSVWASSHEDASWPAKAKITLRLDREVAGASEISIPSSGLAEKHLAGAIASLAQRLPRHTDA